MTELLKIALVVLALTVSTPVFAQEDPGVEAFELKRSDESTYKNVILRQQKLMKKILGIQERTLLMLEKLEDSNVRNTAQTLLGEVSRLKEETKRTDVEINKVSKRPHKNKKGATIKFFTYSEDDDLSP